MSLWYAICDALPLEMLHWDFMKNALLALLLMAPLFGILSTMIVTGHMSFFSDALGHSAFTGIALGSLFGIAAPTCPSPPVRSGCWPLSCWRFWSSGACTPTG